MNKFGEELKRLRMSQGFTQKELANKSELSVIQISNLEQGKFKPSAKTILKISNALNCDYDKLFDLANN